MRGHRGGFDLPGIDLGAWREVATTIEVPHRRWPHIVMALAAVGVVAAGLADGSLPARLLALLGVVVLLPATVAVVRGAPHVIVSDVGISIKGPWSPGLHPEQVVLWRDVVAISPDHAGPETWGSYEGPRWFARRIDTVVMIEPAGRGPLVIRGILSGTTVEELHAEILQRWSWARSAARTDEVGDTAIG